MNKTFYINGGAGRVISAIPALEKFHYLNPNNDFKVLVAGWESLYYSHPLLQNRTFSINQKGVFDNFIRDNLLVVPEPYSRRSYYTQQKSLAEVFDEEINETNDHRDIIYPKLYLQKQEINSIQFLINDKKDQFKKDRTIVFQPYGSGISINNNRPSDTSVRSLDVDDYLKIVNRLSKDFLVIFFGEKQFIHPGDNVTWKPAEDLNVDLRFWMSCISQCDYFLGIDSVGQHIARSFDKPGTVVMGSTFENNVSYPDHFTIFRNEYSPVYEPIRISFSDCDFSQRSNDRLMDFSQEQLNSICQTVENNFKKVSNSKVW